MNLKTKVKSYSFWVSLASAVILILKLVGQKFGFAVDEGLISDLFTSLCAILVLLGIIVVPSASVVETKTEDRAKNKPVAALVEAETKIENNETLEPKNVCVEQVETKVIEEEKPAMIEQLAEEVCAVESETVKVEANFEASLPKASFNLQEFIDKVCSKRSELDQNICKFSEFLQNELESVKNREN